MLILIFFENFFVLPQLRSLPPKKRPRSEVALYYTTRPKRLSPQVLHSRHEKCGCNEHFNMTDFDNGILMPFTACRKSISVEAYETSKLQFWASNIVFLLLLHPTLRLSGFQSVSRTFRGFKFCISLPYNIF